MTFSMDDLLSKFENVNLLCTLVCAGNRRKEQNMVKKTKGFNWGASGTGTGTSISPPSFKHRYLSMGQVYKDNN